VPNGLRETPHRLDDRGEVADVWKEHLLFLDQLLLEIGAQLEKQGPDTRELRVACAVNRDELLQVVRDDREGRTNVVMVRGDDVIDELVEPHWNNVVARVGDRRQCVEGAADGSRIDGGLPTRIDETRYARPPDEASTVLAECDRSAHHRE
jgi:hypothetical protein